MTGKTPLPEETTNYLKAHPKVAEQLERAQKIYQTFGEYLNLSGSSVIIRESGASTNEADLSGTLLRTDN